MTWEALRPPATGIVGDRSIAAMARSHGPLEPLSALTSVLKTSVATALDNLKPEVPFTKEEIDALYPHQDDKSAKERKHVSCPWR